MAMEERGRFSQIHLFIDRRGITWVIFFYFLLLYSYRNLYSPFGSSSVGIIKIYDKSHTR